jgi:predicted mannosyl-3-phosphoglycerate phosphatase (HAD superfamily)
MRGGLNRKWVYNGKEVDQGIARKAQQKPEGEMEGTKTAAAAEAH